METILNDVNWLAVLIAAVVAFILGSLWFSDAMFGKRWRQGMGTPAVPNRPMGPLLAVEAVATFVLAWFTALTLDVSMALAILGALTISLAIKSTHLFGGRTRYSTAVDAGYILGKVAIIIVVLQLFN